MTYLKHEDAVPGMRVGKEPDIGVVSTTGPRGGLRIPTRVLWRPSGTGLFRRVLKSDPSVVVLFPFVEYHNGSVDEEAASGWSTGKARRMRYMTPDEWSKGKLV